MPKRLQLKNKKFNRLTVIEFAYIKNGFSYWLCKCDCDNIKIIKGICLTTNNTKSCGCLRKEYASKLRKKIKHGMRKTKFYGIWCNMKSRCLNPNNKDYKWYGNRGITICDNWINNFENFRDDMLASYLKHCEEFGIKNTTIDRFPDKNGNYELLNCRWATWKEQANNTRRIKL